MQRLGQPLDHVAGLMELAALDWRVGAEGAADGFAQRLGAVDDEQPTDRRVEPALDQIVDQRLDHSGIFGRPLDQAKRMLIAAAIDAENPRSALRKGRIVTRL